MLGGVLGEVLGGVKGGLLGGVLGGVKGVHVFIKIGFNIFYVIMKRVPVATNYKRPIY